MLYIVATPIGNTQDITLRALAILSEVDLILAEDTRKTKTLLQRYEKDLGKKFTAQVERFDEHIDPVRIANIVDQIVDGKSAALVSDAGTPGVSDPGQNLIQELIVRGVKISPIPGASALTSILSVANFSTAPSVFFGFLPKKKGRQTTLFNLKNYAIKYGAKSAVFYESPRRIVKTLSDLAEVFGGNTQVVIGRELTKQFEQVWYGSLEESQKEFAKTKGEFVLILKIA